MQLDVTTVSEDSGVAAITATLARVEAPSVASALDVSISVSDIDELSFPSTVTIPANQTSTTFKIDTINDAVLDGPSVASLTAAASGFSPASVGVTVNDDETFTTKTIGGQFTGTLAKGTYSVSHDLKVPAGESLTIAAGTTILFSADQQLEVEGALTARGNASNPITLGSSAATPASGDWTGVKIASDTQQPDTVIEHVSIQYATYGIEVLGNNAPITITESEISNNSNSSIFLRDDNGQDIVVRNNHLHGNTDHGILLLASDSNCTGSVTPITIEGNEIGPNAKSGIYFRATATASCGATTSPAIVRNRIHDNDVGIAGNAVDSGSNKGALSARIESNFIYDHSKQGLNFSAIPTGSGFISEMNNNTIVSNGEEGVLHTPNTGPEFQLLNNIIQSNTRGVVASATYVPTAGTVGFNNIFDNSSGNFLRYPASFGQATTSNRNGTPSDTEFNVSVDSSFEADNLHIRLDSPMVGAGSDSFMTDLDIDGTERATPSDIGADEVTKLIMTFPPTVVTDPLPTLNETSGTTTVTLERFGVDRTNTLSIALASSDLMTALVPASVTILADNSLTTFDISVVDDLTAKGDRTVQLTATAGNISTMADVLVVDDDSPMLSLTFEEIRSTVDGEKIVGRVTRNTPGDGPLDVNFASDDQTRYTVQQTAVIPAGQSSVEFLVTRIDDGPNVGTQDVSISATALGHASGSAAVPTLIISFDESTLTEDGEAIVGRVTRNTPDELPLVVSLTSGDESEVTVQQTATIRAGQSSVGFLITPVNDGIIDGTQDVTIFATASVHDSASAEVRVLDIPALTVSIPDSVDENAGTVQLIVRRNTDTSSPLDVDLSSDSEVIFGLNTVTIPAGEASVETSASVRDDDVVSNQVLATVTATATGFLAGSDRVLVIDDEVPQLTFSIDQGSINEFDGTATATLRRNGFFLESVIVSISSSADSSVQFDHQVTFPFGDPSISFPIQAIDNALATGDQTVTFTTATTRFPSVMSSVIILDDETPELSISLSGSSVGENGAAITASLQRNTLARLAVVLTPSQAGLVEIPENIAFAQGELTKSFAVVPIDDQVVFGDRSVSISVSAPGHSAASADLLIEEDEIASFVINNGNSQPIVFNESGSDATLSIVLGAQPTADVTLTWQAEFSGQLAVQPSGQPIVFTPDNWDQPQTVTFTPVDDDLAEPTMDFVVEVAVVADQSASPFATLNPQSISLRLEDNDAAGITIEETNGSTFVSETGLSDSYSVHLTAAPLSDVTLDFSAIGLPGVTFDPASISFDRDNWDFPQQVTVNTSADFDVDRDSLGNLQALISTTAFGFTSLNEPVIDVLLVDSIDNDLRLTREDENVIFIDAVSGAILRSVGENPSGRLTTGTRSESILIDLALGSANNFVLDAAGGDDTIGLSAPLQMTIDGGDGFDSVKIFGGETIDLSSHVLALENVELLDLTDVDPQSLILDPATVAAIAGSGGTLMVNATENDVVEVGDGWQAEPTRVDGSTTLHQLVSGNVRLELSNGRPWTNPLVPADVDRSGSVTSLDALRVINRLGQQGDVQELPQPTESEPVVDYFDVSRDGNATALDALQVINFIGRNGESESELVIGNVGISWSSEDWASAVEDHSRIPTQNEKVALQADAYCRIRERVVDFNSAIKTCRRPGE